MMKKQKKHIITFAATQDEMGMIKKIMDARRRKTYSDTIRILIIEENEKILRKNIAIEKRAHAN